MDSLDDFSHLSFIERVSLALDEFVTIPLDELPFSAPIISREDKVNSVRVGGTADIVLPRLLKMTSLALGMVAISKNLCEEDVGTANLEALILKGLIFLRIVDLFPHQKI